MKLRALHRGLLGAGLGTLFLLLASPPGRAWLEASMSTHMLVQMPLLVATGAAAARLLRPASRERLLHGSGGPLPWVLLALFASAYWMLPRSLDAALDDPVVETAKFATLPLLVGFSLALAWRQLGMIGRGLVSANFISMLAVLGWLYIAAPVRVCNNYLVDQQDAAGWLMVQLALILFVCWLGTLFVSDTAPRRCGCRIARALVGDGDNAPV